MKKYIGKEMIQVNKNLRIYKYYYAAYTAVYLVPKNAKDEIIKLIIKNTNVIAALS